MLTHCLRRAVTLPPILLGMSTLVFVIMRWLPGDVISVLLGAETASITPEMAARIAASLGLDRPLHEQYLVWLWGVVRGDFGTSLITSQPIGPDLVRRWPVTIELALFSIVIASAVGVSLGAVAAIRPGSRLDGAVRLFSLLGLAVPGFWIATLLVLVFSLYLPTWPILGFVELARDPLANLQSLLLPAATLGLVLAAALARFTRFSMLEVLHAEYITAARARGLAERRIVVGHALKNAFIPVLTLIGLSLGHLLGGAVVIETIFGLPGLGKLVVDAIQQRDYPMIQGAVLVLSFNVVLVNLVVDVLYGWLNPRIRYE